MSGTICYKRNTDVILNRAKDYYDYSNSNGVE